MNEGRRWSDATAATRFDRARRFLVAAWPFLAAIAVAAVVWGVVLIIATALDTQRTVSGLAEDAKQQARRNTELLLIECNLETGKPGPPPLRPLEDGPPRRRYLNSREVLRAHCLHQKRAAARVSGYIGTIKDGVGEQIQTSENNIMAKLDEVKAAVERRPPPVWVRVPIPRPASPTPAPRVAPRAGGSPAAPPTTAAPNPPPVRANPPTTTTTCPTRGKSEKCR